MMAERRLIVDGLVIRYEGLFNFQELYQMMENWQRQMGYDMFEVKNYEQVFKDGRDIEIQLEPWKKTTDYHKFALKIVFVVKKLKDVVVKKDGVDVKTNFGQLQIKIKAYLETDYFHHWEGKPSFYIMRLLFDNFIYRSETKQNAQMLSEEMDLLYNHITGYLNMSKKNVV
jgi:hypothetical protein